MFLCCFLFVTDNDLPPLSKVSGRPHFRKGGVFPKTWQPFLRYELQTSFGDLAARQKLPTGDLADFYTS
jgi:hypothetical protein